MNLINGLIQPFPYLVPAFINAHFLGKRILPLAAKGAELAQIGADVGIIDVLVVDKKGLVAVEPFAHDIGKLAQRQDVGVFVERSAVFQA